MNAVRNPSALTEQVGAYLIQHRDGNGWYTVQVWYDPTSKAWKMFYRDFAERIDTLK